MMLLSALAIGVFVWAAVTDIVRRQIANRLVFALALFALARLVISAAGGADVAQAAGDLGGAFAVFCVGAALHHFGVAGGGDVKLMSAGALWLGAGQLIGFLTLTALAGGALAIVFLCYRFLRPATRSSLPYGVAIGVAGVWRTLAPL